MSNNTAFNETLKHTPSTKGTPMEQFNSMTKKPSQPVDKQLAKLHALFNILANHHCNSHGSILFAWKDVLHFRGLLALNIDMFTTLAGQISQLNMKGHFEFAHEIYGVFKETALQL
jgi:hypothetical protein